VLIPDALSLANITNQTPTESLNLYLKHTLVIDLMCCFKAH